MTTPSALRIPVPSAIDHGMTLMHDTLTGAPLHYVHEVSFQDGDAVVRERLLQRRYECRRGWKRSGVQYWTWTKRYSLVIADSAIVANLEKDDATVNIDSIMRPSSTPTDAQTKASLKILMAVAETIRELGEVPSGTLYANLIGKIDLAGYQKLICVLEGAGLISVQSHLIRWTGPALEVRP